LSLFSYRTDKKADRKVKKVLKRIAGSKGMRIFAARKKGTFFLVIENQTSYLVIHPIQRIQIIY